MVRALIAAGACVNFHAERRGLASQESVDSRGPYILKMLIDPDGGLHAGGALDASERLGYTALQIAAMKGHLSVVEALIAADADVRAPCIYTTGHFRITSPYASLL